MIIIKVGIYWKHALFQVQLTLQNYHQFKSHSNQPYVIATTVILFA